MNRRIKYILLLLLFIVLVSMFVFFYPRSFLYKLGEEKPLKIGVVDYKSLLELHPSYEELNKLNIQISLLESENDKLGMSFGQLTEEQYKVMVDAQKKAEKELIKEMEIIQKELLSRKKELESQLEQDIYATQQKIKDLQSNNSGNNVKGEMEKFAKDMIALRDRQIAAKELELSTLAKDEIEKQRDTVEDELNQYILEISKQNQDKKLQLQLALMSSNDEEERKKAEEALTELEQIATNLKEQKRIELNVKVENFKKEKEKEIQQKLKKYQVTLDRDLKNQLGLGTNEGSSRIMALQDELDYKRRLMEEELKALSLKAQERFEKKKKDLEKKIKDKEKQMMSEALKQQEELSKFKDENKQKTVSQIEMLKEQRDRLMEKIRSDLEKGVKQVADEYNIPYVIGSYVVNINCKDLTDLSILRIKNMKFEIDNNINETKDNKKENNKE